MGVPVPGRGAVVPQAATTAPRREDELGLSRRRGDPVHKPRHARASCRGSRGGVATPGGAAPCAPSNGIRGAVVLPGDDGPRARPPGPGNPRERPLSHALCREFPHPPSLSAKPYDHEAISADAYPSLRPSVRQQQIGSGRQPPCLRARGGHFPPHAYGGLGDAAPPPVSVPGPQDSPGTGKPPLGAAIRSQVQARLLGQVDLPRVAGCGTEFVPRPHGARGDERGPLLPAPATRVNPPLDIGLPLMDDPRGRPHQCSPGPSHAAGTPGLRRVATTCPSSTAPVAAATARPGDAGGPPSFPGAPGGILVGLSEPARSPHSQHPQPSTSSQVQARSAPFPREGPSKLAPSPPSSSSDRGAQTARTIQSAPSFHSTEGLPWIDDAMKEAWCRSRAAAEAASFSPERALTGLAA